MARHLAVLLTEAQARVVISALAEHEASHGTPGESNYDPRAVRTGDNAAKAVGKALADAQR